MNLDFKEIAGAWFNKLHHTEDQKQLADSRFKICLECPSKKEIFEGKEWSLTCGECGCPLSGKVYTGKTYLDKKKSCPLDKWKEVELEHLTKLGKPVTNKNIKTLI
jgi:hypothetical protein